jgi:hypothetical protein
MPRPSKVALVLILLGGACLSSARARAQEGVQIHAYGYVPGAFAESQFNSPYVTGQIPVPPYFALHPPVYYSYPVPRPYGYSPYAYPSYVMTPTYKPVKPVEFKNPHVPDKSKTDQGDTDKAVSTPRAATHRIAEAPVVMLNPFVDQQPAAPQVAQRRAKSAAAPVDSAPRP